MAKNSVSSATDRYREADSPVLIRTMPNRITSESPTTRPEVYPAHQRKQGLLHQHVSDVSDRVRHRTSR